ncbi:MAG: efflux RND transporter permease subunit [Thermoflexibacter sp.]|jgi:multidrug efflux pump subunit AcrB|nr:efflux RND transporter permease subunit [Thermoflexibacter sp.]
MEHKEQKKSKLPEFGLSTFAIKNKTSVFILTAIIAVMGLLSYNSMPKEQFPEVVIPTVIINTIYPGNSPVDIENLISRHIEKEVKSVKGVKKINSTSSQDVSVIIVEFNENVLISKALQDTKDAVDKSKRNLPTDLDTDPQVLEVDVSQIPIVMVNISGNYDMEKLRYFAEYLEDRFEELPEVSSANLIGALDREIQINADIHKMDARKVTFSDIENAIRAENISMSGGEVLTDGYRRSMRISGEFKKAEDIAKIIVKSEDMDPVYLKDIAEVKDAFVERKSYARLATGEFANKGNSPVISLRVVKKNAENLINADAKIKKIVEEAQKSVLPKDLTIVYTDNQADDMKIQIANLENNIIFSTILVVGVLLFFMGLRNAIFVGIAIPLSMFISFIILSSMGYTVNIMVLFGLVLALGMLVDNGIVVIENIYRQMEEGEDRESAAKHGVGEVAWPIISSTLTTLAAFAPLLFWGGIIGEFMSILPVTLIVVLSSSLFVGLFVSPVTASVFMHLDDKDHKPNRKRITIIGLALMGLSIPFYFAATDGYSLPNLLMTAGLFTLLNAYFLRGAAIWFQNNALVWLENAYLRFLRFALNGKRPIYFFIGTFFSLIFSLMIFGANQPLVLLFPDNEPLYIYLYNEAPLGTDVETTDKITRELEKKVFETLKPYENIVASVVTNVGEGTGNPMAGPGAGSMASFTPHKSKISIGFIDYESRNGVETAEILKKFSEMTKSIPGLKITTGKNSSGPPTGFPVNIEVKGVDYNVLIGEAEKIKNIIEQAGIAGMEGLATDLEIGKPEVLLNIDREKARMLGLSTSSLAMNMRTAIYGKEISKLKDGNDDYPIQLRLQDRYRYDLASLNDQKISFRDNKGKFHQIPISSVADMRYTSSYGSVRRKDLDKVIVVSAGVSAGYNPNQIVEQVRTLLANHKMPAGYTFKFTGEQEEQAQSMAFLMKAMLIAVASIFLILVSQFNSVVKPFIIMTSVLFSLQGVFLGMTIFNDAFIIIMTGIGIISLAGVVVNNAIVLVDYAGQLENRKLASLGLTPKDKLSKEDLIECLVEAGYTRLRPVLLTAITTVLGLIPMAVGLNIDFFDLYKNFDPHIYTGGDNAAFWGPMAWTVVYGLTFATFLTLIIVPVMYLIAERIAGKVRDRKKEKAVKEEKGILLEKAEV